MVPVTVATPPLAARCSRGRTKRPAVNIWGSSSSPSLLLVAVLNASTCDAALPPPSPASPAVRAGIAQLRQRRSFR